MRRRRLLKAEVLTRGRHIAELLESRVLLSSNVASDLASDADLKTGPLAKIGDSLASAYLNYMSVAAFESQPLATTESFTASASPRPGVPVRNVVLHTGGGNILLEAYAKSNGSALAGAIQALHGTDIHTFGKSVTASFPISVLNKLAALPGLEFARPVWFVTSAGSVTSQGDTAERADIARNTYGLTGAGVKVGILSDSFNTAGGADTYATDVTSGDLPGNVQILSDSAGGSDEGRAMAQLIYDSAPGATLAFATGDNGQSAFASSIKALRDAGAKVIVDDLTYLAEPMFEDGPIAQAVDNVVASGVSYFSAAGDEARNSYESAWRTGNVRADGSIPSAVGAPHFYGGTTFDFDPSAATNDLQSFSLASGQSILMSFQWDSPYFSASGIGTSNDMDIYVLNADGTQVLGGSATNNIGGDPTEVFQFTNATGGAGPFNLMLVWHNSAGGSQPAYLKWVDFGSGTNYAFATNSATTFGHANAAGAETVAAAGFLQTPAFGTSPPVVESSSSAGGTPILFDTAGNRLASPTIRQTPDITAPDGGDTTFFGTDTDVPANGHPNFYGTSASAAEAAAVAALLLQQNPALTPAQVDAALQSTAVDMDDPSTPGFDTGYDNRTGFGLIQADAAIAAITGMVSGTVFQDNNGNALLTSGEPGVAGVTVFFDANNNGALDTGEISTTTDGSGNFTLANLPSGASDVIREITPTGFVATVSSKTVNLTGGGSVTGVNLGLFPIVYTGTSGNDSYTLQVDSSVTANLDILVGGVLTYTAAKSLIPSLTFNLGGGDDSLTVNYTSGNPLPSGGVNYDGGANATSAGDSLIVNGSNNGDTIAVTNFFVAPANGAIAVQNLENVTINGNGGNDTLTLGESLQANVTWDGGTGTNTLTYLGAGTPEALTLNPGTISNSTFTTTYANTQTLGVSLLSFNDSINVNLAAGAPTLTITAANQPQAINLNTGSSGSAVTILNNSGSSTITIASGYASPIDVHGPGSNTKIIFNATTGDDAINIVTGKLTTAVSTVTFTNIAGFTVNALDGNDAITVNGAPPTNTTINGGLGNDTLTINSALSSSGSGTVFNGGTTATDQDTLNVNAGTFQLAGDPQVGTANLTVNDNANVIFTAATGGGINLRHLAALNIGAAGIATVNTPASHANRAALVVAGTLSITGKLDLGGNDLIVKNGDINAIDNLLTSGITGNWSGSGITSSAAHADTGVKTALGVLQNTDPSNNPIYTAFDGQTGLTSADVLVKYTYYGDTDLNGKVDGADYTKVDNGFIQQLTGWTNGDFDYVGGVTGADYSLMDNAFNTQDGVVL